MNKSWLAALALFVATPASAIIIVQTVGTSGVAPADWRTGLEMVWQFEGEMAGDDAVNTGTEGSNCDMVDTSVTGTVDRISGSAPEGSTEASFADVKKQSLTNTNVTCDNVWKQDADFTFGCRITPRNANEDMRILDFNDESTAGATLLIENGNDTYRCQVEEAADTDAARSTTLVAAGTEAHIICRYDAGTDVMEIIVNGIDEDDVTSAGMDAATADLMFGNASSGKDLEGEIDECFLTVDKLTDAEICRICSCGIKGDDCRCDAGTPTGYLTCSTNGDCEGAVCDTVAGKCLGFNDAKCIGCNPSVCDAAAP